MEIIEDSVLLTSMTFEDESDVYGCLPFDVDDIRRIYNGDFDVEDLDKLANKLDYIDNIYLMDIIVLMKYKGIEPSNLNLKKKWDNLELENRIEKTIIRYGNINTLIWLHKTSGFKITSKLLKFSSGYCSLKIIKWLFQKVKPNDKLLVVAAKNGNYEIVNFLLELSYTRYINRALKMALYHGHFKVVELLLKYDAKVIRHHDDFLLSAIHSGSIKYIKMFLSKPFMVTNLYTIIIWACKRSDLEIFKLLVSSGINPKNHSYFSYYLLGNCNLDIVKYFHEDGVTFHSDMLPVAIENDRNNNEVFKYLITKKIVDISSESVQKRIISLAIEKGKYELVKLLLDVGCKINAIQYSIVTLRRLINSKCSIVPDYNIIWLEMVKYLIKHGYDVHANDEDLFIFSCTMGCLDAVELLYNMGSNIQAQNNLALRSASGKGKYEVVKFLFEKGIKLNNNYYYGPEVYQDIKLLDIYIEYGLDVKFQNCKLLIDACRSDYMGITNLISRGADPNCQNGLPLLIACRSEIPYNRDMLINTLIQWGANINLHNYIAEYINNNFYIDHKIIKILIQPHKYNLHHQLLSTINLLN